MKTNRPEAEWAEAMTLCGFNAEDVRQARALGISPRSLLKNRPSASQRWKAPVRDWIRDLYQKRFGPGDLLPLFPTVI
ncbi:hypothetical protein IV102_31680 [bacterium]|nr:hypothetical protein [bacterium]